MLRIIWYHDFAFLVVELFAITVADLKLFIKIVDIIGTGADNQNNIINMKSQNNNNNNRRLYLIIIVWLILFPISLLTLCLALCISIQERMKFKVAAFVMTR